ncbi:hypothetical protein [Lactiplantibacillus plantarum]|uniref:hypothetical protein n=1 Tax=Lactiplantibacillus plantarum TaxID=1590 RepID=UPI000787AFF2|nr:hypothetical protein [Lactiplantibacillus plantarum]MCS6093853.1 hypothetical protein [Lactobacillus sp. LMY-20]ASX21142.1 hypothetical protein BGV74_04845 [Lactiplantibacillus plantarum]KYK51879.1 hypothetical protein AYO51_06245 [Lactiplantibacillus plantarum]KYM69363.1 hypothetical protein AZJ01_12060 [Lactiplantibacillus plantarum]KZE02524.1 hypothetical protein FBR6_0503 [Lactiplantibacillus plantarum]
MGKRISKKYMIVFYSFLLLIVGLIFVYRIYQPLNAQEKGITDKWGIYINISDSKEYIDEQLNAAHQVGFKYVRIPVDQLPFGSEYKRKTSLVQYAIDKSLSNKMTPIVNFTGGTPGNYSGKQYTQTIEYLTTDITHFVKNNSNKGIVWEAWNEPNGAFWTNNGVRSPVSQKVINEWLSFDNAMAEIIKKYDKHAVFVSGDLEGNPKNSKSLITQIKNSSAYRGSSIVSFHPYLNKNNNNGRPESLLSLFPKYTVKNPYLVTEFGYSIPNKSRVYEQRLGVWSYQQQAAYLSRAVLILDEKGMPFFTLFNTSNRITNYGIENSGRLNLAGKELRALGRELHGYHFVRTVHTSNTQVRALEYSKKFAPNKIVYWSSNDRTIRTHISGLANVSAGMTPQIQIVKSFYYSVLCVIVLLVGVSILLVKQLVRWKKSH